MSLPSSRWLRPIVMAALLGCGAAAARAGDLLAFVSAFAGGETGGVNAFRLSSQSGELRALGRRAEVANAFALALSPDRRFLYVNHSLKFGGADDEEIAAYRIEGADGGLKLLNRRSSRGLATCYLDATAQAVVAANYASGSVVSLPVREDGSLGEPASFVQHAGSSVDQKRQDKPHAHCIVVSPDGRFALAADLGLDQILVYKLDSATAQLVPNDPPLARTPPGAGPRHLAFHPNGRRVYAINEISNSVTAFDYDAHKGTLAALQTISTLPADFTGKSNCADVKITPDGRFLYGANRGHDSIAAFGIGDDGRLALIGIEPSLGKGPQNLAIAPDGKLMLCANMAGSNVAVFRIDPQSGAIKSIGAPMSLPSPSCIRIVP